MGHEFGATYETAPLITVVSASGGVGKSTIALIMGHLAARAGLRTALVEGDLQFGDMGFWLGIGTDASNLSLMQDCKPVRIFNRLDLFKAPALPEIAEDIADGVAELVESIRSSYDLVIADTGQFWSGLTGSLLCSSSLVLLIMDQREASVYGAIKAYELCGRLGIPGARIACVANRRSGKSRSEVGRIQGALGTENVFCLQDGKTNVESLIGMGRVDEFIEASMLPTDDVERLLCETLPKIGLRFEKQQRKKARRIFS